MISVFQKSSTGASHQVKSQAVFMTSENITKDLLKTVSFQAFNRSFVLHLHPTEDASFHVLRVKEGNSSLEFLRKCLYQGYLENEESSSAVALSVCHGLVSYSMENVILVPTN
ncbi:hypothetical protein TNCT_24571 [Trichonephila clavata]|uniref:Peptidase M12B propeptide domain-containing protein n=1 Tax=Trichonephila clavata TaxID=2740835 RepID=A0A8X6LSF2_TRICU|nr:hypothetical protein TNCT_24571 [Trichonephila clavata]